MSLCELMAKQRQRGMVKSQRLQQQRTCGEPWSLISWRDMTPKWRWYSLIPIRSFSLFTLTVIKYYRVRYDKNNGQRIRGCDSTTSCLVCKFYFTISFNSYKLMMIKRALVFQIRSNWTWNIMCKYLTCIFFWKTFPFTKNIKSHHKHKSRIIIFIEFWRNFLHQKILKQK